MENRIYEIKNNVGILGNEPEKIENVFIDYYKELLGISMVNRSYVNSDIVKRGYVVLIEQR